MDQSNKAISNNPSRRDFIKTSAVVSLAALTADTGPAFAAGSEKIRVGLIGCGDRGVGAAWDCIQGSPSIEIYALGDVFQDKIDYALQTYQYGEKGDSYMGGRLKAEEFNVTPERCFHGFDAYQKVIATDVDLIIQATPPHFRPMHLRAAIEGGKHVFIEKPAAVDPAGIRSVMASGDLAKQKGLSIVAGTHRRNQTSYMETIKRIHDGAIGEIIAAQAYWNSSGMNWHLNPRRPGWSDVEWQIRSWPFFTWLSGDFIVEQHVHNLDIIRWALDSPPVKCTSLGGREVRKGEQYGNIFDHFATEFEFPSGVRVASMCRQITGTSRRVSERVAGTKGTSNCNGRIDGQNPWRYEKESPDPFIHEHTNMVAAIRAGEPINDARRVAESTMMSIMARTSAYTGREISWNWIMNASKIDFTPVKYELGPMPVDPVAIPGQTELL